MGRPYNQKERERILMEAFNIISIKGFVNTSYSDIAKSAGISKSLVQYYFPKKDLIIVSFIEHSLGICKKLLEEDKSFHFDNPLDELYAIGYLQSYFAIYNPVMKYVASSILKDRDNTIIILEAAASWVLKNVDLVAPDDPVLFQKCRNVLVYVCGGALEYLYVQDKYQEPVDEDFLSDISLSILKPLAELTTGNDLSHTDCRKYFSKDWLETMKKRYNRLLFDID